MEDWLFLLWFAFYSIMAVAWVGVLIWAVIKLVGWVTSQ